MVLETIADQVVAIHRESDDYSNDRPLIRFISPLAQGADRLFAAEGLHLSGTRGDVETALQCPLPFRSSDCRMEFAQSDDGPTLDESRGKTLEQEFDALLGKADAIVELDGLCDEEGRGAAYAMVGRYVLNRSDLLLAVWDGGLSRGPGGTRDIVERARELEIPTVWIHSREPHTVRLSFGHQEATLEGECRELRERVRYLLLPPASLQQEQLDRRRERREHSPEDGDSARKIEAQRRARERYFEERLRRKSLYHYGWDAFLALIAPLRGEEPSEKPPEPDSAEDELAQAKLESIRNAYREHFERSDQLANHYAGLYRGAFLVNYLLGALVVVLALWGNADRDLKGVLVPTEIALITWIIFNVWLAKVGEWHQRSLDYRFLAEQFREMGFMAPLGLRPPLSRLPAQYHDNDPRQSWMNWAFRSVEGEIGVARPPSGAKEFICDAAFLKRYRLWIAAEWIQDQIGYHRLNGGRMERAHERLERWMWVLIAVVLVALSAQLLVDPLVGLLARLGRDLDRDWMLDWLTVVVAGTPALVAAMHGLRYQGEFRRLFERSATMASQLTVLHADLMMLEWHDRGCWSRELGERVIPVAQAMTDEVTDWRIVYKVHEVGLT